MKMPIVKEQNIAVGLVVIMQGPQAGSIGLIINV